MLDRRTILGVPHAAAVAIGIAALTCSGCRRNHGENARATAEAEGRASETSLTSASVEAKAGEGDEDRSSGRGTAEAIVALREEQLAARDALKKELDGLDQARERSATRTAPLETKAIDARRALLASHLHALDRTSDGEWPALRARIERDLADHGGGAAARSAPVGDSSGLEKKGIH